MGRQGKNYRGSCIGGRMELVEYEEKMKIVDKRTKAVLPKNLAWGILIFFVFLDAFLDLIFAEGKGIESNILKPIADLFGINNPVFLTPFVLLIFFVFVKFLAFFIEKIDKIPKAEELVLTTFVLVYGIFDLWLISVYFFDFKLFRNYFYLIPILILAGAVYEWWAEKKLKGKV